MTASSNTVLLIASLAVFAACSHQAFRFSDAPVVTHIQDDRPIPLPKETRYIRLEYYYRTLVRRPLSDALQINYPTRSLDVNSMDDIPASSWYTPRLGYRDISENEIVTGPQNFGPPELPVRVVRAKHSGNNPGFIIADSRDQLYLVKFDPPDFPGIQTTTAFIVNRLFWAFGYNVPEDYLFYLRESDCLVDSTADISEEEVQLVFSTVAPPQNGYHRTTVSRLIDGIYLGPTADVGVREDDPNDVFPHERRRVLRALRVFAAFTNQTDIRIDNSLDVYVGTPGEGFVKHYLLDFGEAFGGHGAEHDRPWDGYRHIFSFAEFFSNGITLGLKQQPWESIEYTKWPSVGAFESEVFDPATWKESYPYAPIRMSQPDDNYWAAKVLSHLTESHLKALLAAAVVPTPEAESYLLNVLLERKQKILDYCLKEVTPLEFVRYNSSRIVFRDIAPNLIELPQSRRYHFSFYDDVGKQVLPHITQTGSNSELQVDLDLNLIDTTYLRVQVVVEENGVILKRPAEFHFRTDFDNRLTLVGVVH